MPVVNEYLTLDPVTARGDEGMLAAARRMRELHVGCLIVVEHGQDGRRYPIGMLTDRDIVVGLLAQTDHSVHLVRVDDVMTRRLVLAKETDDLAATLKRMRKAGVRRVPVVDAGGALTGVLSLDDVFVHLEGLMHDLTSLVSHEREREIETRGS